MFAGGSLPERSRADGRRGRLTDRAAVHESVPVMLLDSLEAIDSDRIRELVTYFADSPDYLLVALLPEDAAALPERYERVPAERALT